MQAKKNLRLTDNETYFKFHLFISLIIHLRTCHEYIVNYMAEKQKYVYLHPFLSEVFPLYTLLPTYPNNRFLDLTLLTRA